MALVRVDAEFSTSLVPVGNGEFLAVRSLEVAPSKDSPGRFGSVKTTGKRLSRLRWRLSRLGRLSVWSARVTAELCDLRHKQKLRSPDSIIMFSEARCLLRHIHAYAASALIGRAAIFLQ